MPEKRVTKAMASMQAIVTSGQRNRQKVRAKQATKRRGGTPSQNADATAARKMPVPAADSGLKVNSASSGLRSSLTTGRVRAIALSRPGTFTLIVVRSSTAFTCGNPQQKTKMVSSSQGTHADATSRAVCVARREEDSGGAGDTSSGKCHVCRGCQTRRNRARQTNETSPPTTSTSQGP